MKLISLGNDSYAKVDDEDFEYLNKFIWHNANGYAIRNAYLGGGRAYAKRRNIIMSRLITNAPIGMEVDHKNHDTLDNQKSNLRVCTQSQNRRNAKVKKNSTTGLKGVSPYTRGGYRARIIVDGKRKELGVFKTPELAHAAYNQAALKHFGEFAYNTTRTAA